MGDIYGSITFRNNNDQLIWTMNGPFSPPLLIGLLAGGISCTYEIADYNGQYFVLSNDRQNIRVNHPSNIDNEYTKLTNIPIYQLIRTYNTNSTYSVWIYNGETNDRYLLYDLYGFETIQELKEFLQGVLTMCNAFNVDPDNIIASCPIIAIEGTYNYLAIEGIILPLLPEELGGYFIYPLDEEGLIFPNSGTYDQDYDYDDP